MTPPTLKPRYDLAFSEEFNPLELVVCHRRESVIVIADRIRIVPRAVASTQEPSWESTAVKQTPSS